MGCQPAAKEHAVTGPLSQDPIIRKLVAQAQAASLSRRGLFKGLGLGAAALGAGSLAACSGSSGPGDGSAGSVRWANWTYYLDYDEETGTYPSLDAFQEATNIRVEYFEDIDDNKTFIAKIKDQLKLGQDTGYDTFCLTDSSLVRLLEQDQLMEFDRSLLPNVGEQMIPLVQKASGE